MNVKKCSLLIVGLLLLSSSGFSADWPGWRGPNRDGKSMEKGLLDKWPEGGPKLKWTGKGLGTGYSSVSVVNGMIFTMGDIGDNQYAIGLKEKDGSIVWKTKVGGIHEDQFPGPRSTPSYSEGHVYVLSTEGTLYCLNAKTGKEVWKKSFSKEFGGKVAKNTTTEWRFSESTLVDGDRLIVTPGGPDAMLVALSKKDGKVIWKTGIPELGENGRDGAAYSSVVISNAGGVKQYVQLVGRGVIGVEAQTGRFLWGYNRVANKIANIATPIIHGDQVFTSTGYNTGSALINLKKDGDGFAAEEGYYLTHDVLQNHHGGLILLDGHIFTGTGHNKGFPICVEMASGKVKWGPIRNEGKSSAAITYADGHIYFRYQDGRMILVEANANEYIEKGSFMIPDVNQFSWAQPVIANGQLILREQDNLYCYDIRK